MLDGLAFYTYTVCSKYSSYNSYIIDVMGGFHCATVVHVLAGSECSGDVPWTGRPLLLFMYQSGQGVEEMFHGLAGRYSCSCISRVRVFRRCSMDW